MKANLTPKIFGRAARTFTVQALGLLISFLVTTTVTRAAETNHAAVYQGIGNTYAEETSTILI